MLRRVRFDFASDTLLTIEQEERRTAILLDLFDCLLFLGGTGRGRASVISKEVIDGFKVVNTVKAILL